MKRILTHLAAFIAGIIALPLGIFITVKVAPNALPGLCRKATEPKRNIKRGVAALKTAKTERERFYYLGGAAKELFNVGQLSEAKKCAEELASLTPKYKDDWNYGNAIQDANLIFGRIAVIEGNIEAAKAYLLASAKSSGSPQMNSFGPNVSLAKDLLEKGERDTVVEYFEACRKFWRMDRGRLDDWIALVKDGETPYFGGNLRY